MTDYSTKVKKLARRLRRANRKKSWRQLALEYQPVTAATLCHIAKADGAYVPKDETMLIALGLKKQRKPRTRPITHISQMNIKDLRAAVRNRDLPFVLGWLKGGSK